MTAASRELEQARRFLAVDWAAVARHRANKRRLAEGKRPWNFVINEVVPSAGNPPITR